MVDNAGVHTNTDFWTIANLSATGGNAGVCNYGECEFYDRNFKFYQTLALSTGTWEFGVTGFHRAGNHSTYFYAGVDKILIPGVESSVVNNMADAKTYFDNGNGKVALKFLVETAGDIEIGIDNQDTETDKWTIFRDFTLKYFGAPDYSIYTTRLAELATEAAAIKGTVPAAVYTTLNDVVTTNNTTHDNKAEYIAAVEAIENAIAEAVTKQGAYAAYNTLNTAVQALYDVADYEEVTNGAHETLGTALSTAAADVETKTTVEDINAVAETLKDAGATYAGAANPTGNAKFNLTFLLTNPDLTGYSWTTVDGWNTDQNQPVQNSQAMYTEGEGYYYEYWSEATNATEGYTVYLTTSLPEGTYEMTAKAKAGWGAGASQPNGAQAITFSAGDTDGSAITATTLADAQIDFVQKENGEVKIGLKAHEGNTCNWMGIGYVELYEVPATVITIDEDVDFVAQSAAATVELKRTIKANTWNTIVLPFQLNADELKAAFGDDVEIAEFSENSENAEAAVVNFTTMETPAIAPNKPVLLKTSTAGSEYTFEGRTIAEGEAKVAGANVTFVGTYAAVTAVKNGDYFIGNDQLWKSSGNSTIKGTRAYIDVPRDNMQVKMFINGITTSISEINGAAAAENGAIFNLAGQRVGKAQKGIFIQNGKKVIVK